MHTDIPISITHWISEKDMNENREGVEDLPEFEEDEPIVIPLPEDEQEREDLVETIELLEEANNYRIAGQIFARQNNITNSEHLAPLIDIRRALEDPEYMHGPDVFNNAGYMDEENAEEDAEGEPDQTNDATEEDCT